MKDNGNILSLNVRKMTELLTGTFSSAINSGFPLKKLPSVMLWGAPGVGKSQGVRQVASALQEKTGKKVTVTDVRLLLFNPVDLRGIPTANSDKTLAVWLKPKIFQMDDGNDTVNILFLDEISAAPPSVQAAAYQITLDRTVGEHRLPDNCIVIAAGNRVTDRSVAYSMPKALANRLCHLEIIGDTDSWLDFAHAANLNEQVISFIDANPSRLIGEDVDDSDNAFATPRSWEMVSNLLNCTNGDIDTVFPMIVGCIGVEAANEFRTYTNVYSKLPSVEDIFNGLSTAVPNRPEALFAIVTRLTEYLGAHKARSGVENVVNYAKAMPPEFRAKLYYNMSKINALQGILKDMPEFEFLIKQD